MIRTRFAPSPTGHLHIGGARTAIFSWLYARRHGGQFILRIEDTDRERSTDESIDQIIEAMEWLGMDYDEGPFRQTERSEIYQKYIDQLLSENKAYRCVCSKEALDIKRKEMMKSGQKPKYDGTCRGKNITADCGEPFVVRFAIPEGGVTKVEDLLRGVIEFKNEELDDIIIARADGTPTYNFCVVIDDADMRITHVIRGDDHLANTPRQAVIYNALRFDMPKFAHVSMVLGKDGARLSKRHGAMSVMEYRELGFLPGALVNYLVRLGWSHGDQEVFTVDELKKLFDLDSVTKSAAKFDVEKLTWLNGEHIKTEPAEKLAPLIAEKLVASGVEAETAEITKILPMYRERAKTILGLAELMRFNFRIVGSGSATLPTLQTSGQATTVYEEKAAKKFLKPEKALYLRQLADRLEKIEPWAEANIETEFRELVDMRKLKLKELAQPVRVALTGGSVSPGLFEVMKHLGREKCIARIRAAAEYAESQQG